MKIKVGKFTLYSSDDTRAKWELKNYLDDGETIASRYFGDIKEAKRFAKSEGWEEEDYSIVPLNRDNLVVNKDFITKLLSDHTYSSDVDTVEEALQKFGKLHSCDEGIDDGIDDDDCEDEYLMYASFDLTTKDGNSFHIILYYGNNSFLFTDFKID